MRRLILRWESRTCDKWLREKERGEKNRIKKGYKWSELGLCVHREKAKTKDNVEKESKTKFTYWRGSCCVEMRKKQNRLHL
jgi:hypothetical protein